LAWERFYLDRITGEELTDAVMEDFVQQYGTRGIPRDFFDAKKEIRRREKEDVQENPWDRIAMEREQEWARRDGEWVRQQEEARVKEQKKVVDRFNDESDARLAKRGCTVPGGASAETAGEP
jgi:hypothetical protein